MSVFETVLLKAFKWLLPAPHRAGQLVANAGDFASTTSAKLYFKALRRLGELESQGGR